METLGLPTVTSNAPPLLSAKTSFAPATASCALQEFALSRRRKSRSANKVVQVVVLQECESNTSILLLFLQGPSSLLRNSSLLLTHFIALWSTQPELLPRGNFDSVYSVNSSSFFQAKSRTLLLSTRTPDEASPGEKNTQLTVDAEMITIDLLLLPP
jgi:hypothetical protein